MPPWRRARLLPGRRLATPQARWIAAAAGSSVAALTATLVLSIGDHPTALDLRMQVRDYPSAPEVAWTFLWPQCGGGDDSDEVSTPVDGGSMRMIAVVTSTSATTSRAAIDGVDRATGELSWQVVPHVDDAISDVANEAESAHLCRHLVARPRGVPRDEVARWLDGKPARVARLRGR